jgi:hypothetical protein
MQNTLEILFEVNNPGYIETYYTTPALTKLINEGNGAASLTQSKSYYRKAEQLIMKPLPVRPALLWQICLCTYVSGIERRDRRKPGRVDLPPPVEYPQRGGPPGGRAEPVPGRLLEGRAAQPRRQGHCHLPGVGMPQTGAR